MKPRKMIKEIDTIILHIESIVNPLQSAATKLRAAQSSAEKDEAVDKTLTAVKEARLLVQQALNGSET